MQLIPMFAEITDALKVVGGVVAVLFVFFIFAGIWASRYTKVGPNQVLVISGRKRKVVDPDGNTREVGFRIVKGGGRFVWPVYEKVDILSLEILTIDVQTPEVYTSKGVPVSRKSKSRAMTSPSPRPRNNFLARAPTKSRASPCRRLKAICARF
jgi:flotillin